MRASPAALRSSSSVSTLPGDWFKGGNHGVHKEANNGGINGNGVGWKDGVQVGSAEFKEATSTLNSHLFKDVLITELLSCSSVN